MKKRIKLFLFRWKLRFSAKDICRTHFIVMRNEGTMGRPHYVCPECVREKSLRRQALTDDHHWEREEILDQCRRLRKELHLPEAMYEQPE